MKHLILSILIVVCVAGAILVAVSLKNIDHAVGGLNHLSATLGK